MNTQTATSKEKTRISFFTENPFYLEKIRQVPIIGVTGPPGGGKTTLIKVLLEKCGELLPRYAGFYRLITDTTRKKSERDDAKDYNFRSNDEFDSKIQAGRFIEYEGVYEGNRYGLTFDAFNYRLRPQALRIITFDTKGALKFMERFPNTVLPLFVAPTDRQKAINWLRDRDLPPGELDEQPDAAAIKKFNERVETLHVDYDLLAKDKRFIPAFNDGSVEDMRSSSINRIISWAAQFSSK